MNRAETGLKQGLLTILVPRFFCKDYLQLYCGGQIQLREKREEPVIGFCGQASISRLHALFRDLRNRYRQLQYQLGATKWQPPPFETSSFRKRVLERFENQAGLQTNFVLRNRYHAGNEQDKSDTSPEKLAFVNNILDLDYTVCVRGGGNFSVRFYETLALGRIPIFIDTDCLLPFEDMIDYKGLFIGSANLNYHKQPRSF